MSINVVGSGLGRTGTFSLKLGLERLLGEPCYHMYEVFQHLDHVPHWRAAADGNMPDWDQLFNGFGAAVDWPASAFWREISEAYPDALIIHSVRDPESWWNSAHETIFQAIPSVPDDRAEWLDMVMTILGTRFTADIQNKEACIEVFNRHNEEVIRTAPKDRLLVWQAKDGYAPICERLGLPVPEEPFPRANTKEEFLARMKPEEAATH